MFRRCVTFCKEYKLCSRWYWLRYSEMILMNRLGPDTIEMIPILVEPFRNFHLKLSSKRDKNVGNFLVRRAFQTSDQPGTFICARARCKTCPFICIPSDPSRSLIISPEPQPMLSLCKKLYIRETGRRLGDRYWEHLRGVENDNKDASKPVARHLISPIVVSNIWQSAAYPYIRYQWTLLIQLIHSVIFHVAMLQPIA